MTLITRCREERGIWRKIRCRRNLKQCLIVQETAAKCCIFGGYSAYSAGSLLQKNLQRTLLRQRSRRAHRVRKRRQSQRRYIVSVFACAHMSTAFWTTP